MRTVVLPAASALTVVLVLISVPLLLWHRLLAAVVASFHWSLGYLAVELGPWLLFAGSIAFLVPVAIDDTPDASAEVPERFRQVQWTRLPGGETSPAFV